MKHTFKLLKRHKERAVLFYGFLPTHASLKTSLRSKDHLPLSRLSLNCPLSIVCIVLKPLAWFFFCLIRGLLGRKKCILAFFDCLVGSAAYICDFFSLKAKFCDWQMLMVVVTISSSFQSSLLAKTFIH